MKTAPQATAVGSAQQAGRNVTRLIGFDNTVTQQYRVQQAENLWCWAAGLEMAFKIHGVKVPQATIAGRTHGYHNGKPLAYGGGVEDITRWLNSSFIQDGHHIVFRSTLHAPLPSAPAFKKAVKVRPVVLWKQVNPQYGHILICTGVDKCHGRSNSMHKSAK